MKNPSKVQRLFPLFAWLVLGVAPLAVAQAPAADPLSVRVQPSGDVLGTEYALQNEERTYFGNVQGGTPPYEARWEFSNGGDTAFAAVGDPWYIETPPHTFDTSGTHWARLTVRDATAATDAATINLRVVAAANDDLARQKNSAIDRGLRYLYRQEQRTADGSSWSGTYGTTAYTGMALIALENHGHNLESPDEDIYKRSVEEGIRYLLNNTYPVDLSSQNCIGDPEAGDSDGEQDGTGVVFTDPSYSWAEMYSDPIAVLALVNSCERATAETTMAVTTDPSRFVNGMSLWDVAVDAKDFIAFAQNDGTSVIRQASCSSGDGLGNVYVPASGLSVLGLNASRRSGGDADWENYSPSYDNYLYLHTTGLDVTDLYAWLASPSTCPGTFTIDWGDGTAPEDFVGFDFYCPDYGYVDGPTHTYPASGTYTISVSHEGRLVGSVDITPVTSQLVCPGTFTVDWGDGSPTEDYPGWDGNCPADTSIWWPTHEYATAGSYPVSVFHEGETICSVDVTVAESTCDEYGNGWRYGRNFDSADNSVTQWPVLALEEANKRWGIDVNLAVISQLDDWLAYSQTADGGFGYTGPDGGNFARTAAGVAMLHYTGHDPTSPRMQSTLSFIDAEFDEHVNGWGWNFYEMYAFFKGMKYLEMEDFGGRDWEAVYDQYIVEHQEADHGWSDTYAFDKPFATSVALAILAPLNVLPPIADAGGPYADVTAGQSTLLDGTGSHHQDQNKHIVRWEWDFNATDGLWWESKAAPGAGEGALGETTNVSYPDTGQDETYTVTLRVIDNTVPDPLTDTDTATIHVTTGNVAPDACTNGPWAGLPNETITFDGSCSSDANACAPGTGPQCLGDAIVSYEWDLDGDGLYNEANGDDGMPVTPGDYGVVTRSFPEPVSRSAFLRVTDSFGLQDTSSAQFNIIAIAVAWGENYTTCFRERVAGSRTQETRGLQVLFKNVGTAPVDNLVMTLTRVPSNLTIQSGMSDLGSLLPDEEKVTVCDPSIPSAEIEVVFDRRVFPSGNWLWKAEFDYNGEHYVINDIPPLQP